MTATEHAAAPRSREVSWASLFLARLIGPLMVVIGVGMLANSSLFRPIAEEFLESLALIYLSGLLAMVAGLAIVIVHNVWTADWRVIVTVIGWLATIGGAVRIVAPQAAQIVGEALMLRSAAVAIAGIAIVGLGGILCVASFRHPRPTQAANGS